MVPGNPESCGGMKSVSIVAPTQQNYFRRRNLKKKANFI